MVLSLALCAFGCGKQPDPSLQRFEASRVIMGTTARVVLYAKDEAAAREGFDKAFQALEFVDHALSDYREDGAVAATLAKGSGRHTTNRYLIAALHQAQRIHDMTSGAFDVTIGPVVALWRENRVPTDDEIAAARARMGGFVVHSQLELELLGDDMRFDFGGIGKGFGAEIALSALDRRGIDRALVDIGGDIALGRPPPGQSGWVVVVADRRVELRECGVAASGTAERGAHILDPRTGRPVTHGHAVWVVASDALDADALASAYSVMTRDEAVAHANGIDDVHVVLEWEEDGKRRRRTSAGFPGP